MVTVFGSSNERTGEVRGLRAAALLRRGEATKVRDNQGREVGIRLRCQPPQRWSSHSDHFTMMGGGINRATEAGQ